LNSIDISKENIKMYTRALTTMESYYLLELPPDSDI